MEKNKYDLDFPDYLTFESIVLGKKFENLKDKNFSVVENFQLYDCLDANYLNQLILKFSILSMQRLLVFVIDENEFKRKYTNKTLSDKFYFCEVKALQEKIILVLKKEILKEINLFQEIDLLYGLITIFPIDTFDFVLEQISSDQLSFLLEVDYDFGFRGFAKLSLLNSL